MSGLYFRGKLAYATAFADRGRPSTFVITPTRGLQPPDLIDHPRADRRVRRRRRLPGRRALSSSAAGGRPTSRGRDRAPRAHRPARQRRHREVPRRAVRGLRRSPVVSVGLRRSRRHEPWRADAACRRRGRRARVRRAHRSDAPARTPAPASHASPIIRTEEIHPCSVTVPSSCPATSARCAPTRSRSRTTSPITTTITRRPTAREPSARC